jgi:2,4-dihydroxy-1,4-benzoxazin-3-one-glucoside dioxygenase
VGSGGCYDRRRELQAFDDTRAGVKGLLDAGATSIPAIFHHPPDSLRGRWHLYSKRWKCGRSG